MDLTTAQKGPSTCGFQVDALVGLQLLKTIKKQSWVVFCPLDVILFGSDGMHIPRGKLSCQGGWDGHDLSLAPSTSASATDSEMDPRSSQMSGRGLSRFLEMLETNRTEKGQYNKIISGWLVVWNMNVIFPCIGNFIIPTDELIFFRGVGQPPTSWVCLKQATRLPLNLMVKDLVSPFKWPQLGGRGPHFTCFDSVLRGTRHGGR